MEKTNRCFIGGYTVIILEFSYKNQNNKTTLRRVLSSPPIIPVVLQNQPLQGGGL